MSERKQKNNLSASPLSAIFPPRNLSSNSKIQTRLTKNPESVSQKKKRNRFIDSRERIEEFGHLRENGKRSSRRKKKVSSKSSER